MRYYVAEGFPDRRYRADGSLVPRSEPDAVLHDPAEIEAQVIRLVSEGKVATLCIHGDDPRAVANARARPHAFWKSTASRSGVSWMGRR